MRISTLDVLHEHIEGKDYVFLPSLDVDRKRMMIDANVSVRFLLTDVVYEAMIIDLPSYITFREEKIYGWWMKTELFGDLFAQFDVTFELKHPSGYYRPAHPVAIFRQKCSNVRCTCSLDVKKQAEHFITVLTPYINEAFPMSVYIEDISPVVREWSDRDWDRAGTFEITYENDPEQECYVASIDNMRKLENISANQTVLAIDLETLGHTRGNSTKAIDPRDAIYMASIVIQSSNGDTRSVQHLHTIAKPNLIDPCFETFVYDNEIDLIKGIFDDIVKLDPDIILGWNVLGFDFGYLATRIAIFSIEVANISRWPKFTRSEFKSIPGPKGRQYMALLAKGRTIMDAMMYIMKIIPQNEMPSYNLKTVSETLLGKGDQSKIDLSYQEQFAIVRRLLSTGVVDDDFSRLCDYCMRDSTVVLAIARFKKMYDQINAFMNTLTASAQDMATSGLSRQIEGAIYRAYRTTKPGHYFKHYGGFKKEKYQGGLVHCSDNRHRHHNIMIFDVASMYPSIMIAYGLDPSKFLIEDHASSTLLEHMRGYYTEYSMPYTKISEDVVDVPDDEDVEEPIEEIVEKLTEDSDSDSDDDGDLETYIASFEDKRYGIPAQSHPFSEKTMRARDAVSEQRKRIFVVNDSVKKGAIPTLLINLKKKRGLVRKDMERIGKLNFDYARLDAIQNAIKIAMNSIYGVMASAAKYASFPVAALTTAHGRRIICETNMHIKKLYPDSRHLYSDTDSTMVHFNELDAIADRSDIDDYEKFNEMMKFAHVVNKEINSIHPKQIVFEVEAIARSAIFICPKMYIMRLWMPKSDKKKEGDDYKQRGILERRSNCPPIARQVIGDVRKLLLDRTSTSDAEAFAKIKSVCKIFATAIYEGKSDHDDQFLFTIRCRPASEYKSDGAPMVVLQRMSAEKGFVIPPGTRVFVGKYLYEGETKLFTAELANYLGLSLNYYKIAFETFIKPISKFLVSGGLTKSEKLSEIFLM